MKIRHLGIAVDSIEERLPVWESFGLKLHHTEEVDSEGVTTAHLKVGGYEIELLEPMGKDTPVGKFIDKKGPGLHHLGSRPTSHMRTNGGSVQDQERRGEIFSEVFHYNSMGILIGVSQGRSDIPRPRSTLLPCKFVLQDDGC